MGMSLGVRSEGKGARGQSQLDSTQEGTGLRKEGEGGVQGRDINIELMGEALTRMCNGPWKLTSDRTLIVDEVPVIRMAAG